MNVASRIESLAAPGGVFISEKLFDEIRNSEGISAKSLGYFELKNVKQPMQVYAITNPGIVVPRGKIKRKNKKRLTALQCFLLSRSAPIPKMNFSAMA